MSSFYDIDSDGVLNVMPSCTINETVAEAIGLARGDHMAEWLAALRPSSSKTVKFRFNEVVIVVEGDSDPELILRDWNRSMKGYLDDDVVVGPHPKAELSAEELAKDAEIEAANQARYAAKLARRQVEAKIHHDRVEARMANAPKMEFSDEQVWLDAKAVNESDPYGAGILAYAQRWARMMQLEMSEGKPLEEIWDTTRDEADLEGMSGFSGSFAANLLTRSWVHGAELRRLYNARWGSSSTTGTANPAVRTLGEKP